MCWSMRATPAYFITRSDSGGSPFTAVEVHKKQIPLHAGISPHMGGSWVTHARRLASRGHSDLARGDFLPFPALPRLDWGQEDGATDFLF